MDDVVVVQIAFKGERCTPRLIATALQKFFLNFDIGETRIEFVGGDPDDVLDTKRALQLS